MVLLFDYLNTHFLMTPNLHNFLREKFGSDLKEKIVRKDGNLVTVQLEIINPAHTKVSEQALFQEN